MKIWVYRPRGQHEPTLHWNKQEILDDMEDSFEWAKEEDPDGELGIWSIGDDHIFVDDDGGEAWLVEVPTSP